MMVCLHNTYGRHHLCTTYNEMAFRIDEMELFVTVSFVCLGVCVCECMCLYCHNTHSSSKTTPKTVFICNLHCQWLYCYFPRRNIHFFGGWLGVFSSIYFLSISSTSIYFIETPQLPLLSS